MPNFAEDLAEYAYNLKYEDLSEKVVQEAKRKIIDALGCAIAAFDSKPVKIARNLAIGLKKEATILGTSDKTSLEMATFVNGSMVRYLDFMDTYFYNGEYVHPADNLSAIISTAEVEGSSGKEVILATVLANEICCRLVDFANIRKRGWDHVIWITISSAVASSKLLKTDPSEIKQTISISISSNIPLRQIRIGGLSMWKGLAAPYAAKAGVFSALLAKNRITGPNEIFEGQNGFYNQISKKRFSIKKFCRSGDKFKIRETHIKKYPAEINSQSAIEAALEIRRMIKGIGAIREINIHTFRAGYEIIADKEKWYPTNRETADHSLPYIVCAALVDGEITEKQFSIKRIADPKIKALIKKTVVKPSRECDKYYYPGTPTIVEVFMKSGKKYSSKVIHPRGFYKNPMSNRELEDKFRSLTKRYLTSKQIENCLKIIWNLDKHKNIKKLIRNFVVRK